jgi:hypothetical protein
MTIHRYILSTFRIATLAIVVAEAVSAILVIPVAAATRTSGGVAGEVVRVTSLAPDGRGSLRSALAGDTPRLIVFEVGGVIDLGGRTLVVRHPHVTVAGQTAPDPGITLIRGGLVVEAHDVVIQHIAVRPGDNDNQTGWAPDALGVRRGERAVYDVLFDHCSATWAIDENLSTSGPGDVDSSQDPDVTAHDITIRNCLIAEGLSKATHPKGEHSKGTLVHDGVRNVTILHSLYAHNHERNPRLKGGTTAVIAGTLMYNWGSGCVGVGAKGNQKMLQPAEAVLAGNVAIAGPDTRATLFVKGLDPGARLFLDRNVAVTADGNPMRLTDNRVVTLGALPPWAPSLPAVDPWRAAARVLRSAGSRPARRDPIDRRIVESVIRGEGTIIDSQRQVGGYPVRPQTTREVAVPDGAEARREWLERLSRELSEDASVDVAPLLRRLGITSSAAPSPGSRK